MANRRRANENWSVEDNNGCVETWEAKQVAVLMDIRDELQRRRGAWRRYLGK